ncbi:hypothetical protein F5Y13DRAFT_69479 [Hypoxylon sp. FL1857]|nr:hypothetical protein F5Y13DRAFT_69479 [Hypoxylon sp. FL1857]
MCMYIFFFPFCIFYFFAGMVKAHVCVRVVCSGVCRSGGNGFTHWPHRELIRGSGTPQHRARPIGHGFIPSIPHMHTPFESLNIAAGVTQADVTSFFLPAPADQLPLPDNAACQVPNFPPVCPYRLRPI